MVKRPPRSNLLSIWLRAPRPPYSGRPSSQWLTPRFDRATGKAAPSMAPLLVGVPPAGGGDPFPAALARTSPPAPLRRRPWRRRSPARGATASDLKISLSRPGFPPPQSAALSAPKTAASRGRRPASSVSRAPLRGIRAPPSPYGGGFGAGGARRRGEPGLPRSAAPPKPGLEMYPVGAGRLGAPNASLKRLSRNSGRRGARRPWSSLSLTKAHARAEAVPA